MSALTRQRSSSSAQSLRSAPTRARDTTSNAAAQDALEPTTEEPGLLESLLAEGSTSSVPFADELGDVFSEDFSDVRAVLGAPQTLEGIGARAVAIGDTVGFADASPDKELVAHELAHVVQGRHGAPAGARAKDTSDPGDSAEHQADAAARSAVHGDGAIAASVSEAPAAASAPLMRKPAAKPAAPAKPGDNKPPESGFTAGLSLRQTRQQQQAYNKTKGQMLHGRNLNSTKYANTPRGRRDQKKGAEKQLNKLNEKNHKELLKSLKGKGFDKSFSKNAFFPLPLGGLMATVGVSGKLRAAPKTGFEDTFDTSKAEGKYSFGYDVALTGTIGGGLAVGVPWANFAGTLDTTIAATAYAGFTAQISHDGKKLSGFAGGEVNLGLEGRLQVCPTVNMMGQSYKYPIDIAKYKFGEFNPKIGLQLTPAGFKVKKVEAADLKVKSPFAQSKFYKWLTDDNKAHAIVQKAIEQDKLKLLPADVKAMLFSRIRDSVVMESHEGSMVALLAATPTQAERWTLVERAYKRHYPKASPSRRQLIRWMDGSIDNHWSKKYWRQTKELMGIK